MCSWLALREERRKMGERIGFETVLVGVGGGSTKETITEIPCKETLQGKGNKIINKRSGEGVRPQLRSEWHEQG
jgi:hypothetical protein